IVIFDALRSGPTRATTLAIALPLSIFIFDRLPQTIFIGSFAQSHSSGTAGSVLFGMILIVLFFLVYRMTFAYGPSGGFMGALIAGITAAVVTVVMWLQEPALQNIWHFSSQIQNIFGTPYALIWLIVAY